MLARLAVACVALVWSAAHAAAPSIEDIWRLPAYMSPAMSDNSRYMAVTMPVNGRMNLAIVDMNSRKATVLTSYEDYDVMNVHWVGNERLVYSLGQFSTPVGDLDIIRQGGLFAIGRDGKEFRVLTPTVKQQVDSGAFVYRYMQYADRVPGSDEEIFAEGNFRTDEGYDIYRVNVRTGQKTLVTFEHPERVGQFILARNDVPRVALSGVKKENITIVSYRAKADGPWTELYRFDNTARAAYPLYFDDDNETLIVASSMGRDTMAIFKYDPRTKQFGEMLAQHPRYDMGADEVGSRLPGIIVDVRTRKIVGFRVDGAKLETVWIDSGYAALQKGIDAALPGTINVFRRTPDGKRLLISAYSDRRPVTWYLLDEQTHEL